MKPNMNEEEIKKLIDNQIEEKFIQRDKENASGLLFDQKTGRHTQGKNVIGLFGDRVDHSVIRTKRVYQQIDASDAIKFVASDMEIDTAGGAATDTLIRIEPGDLAKSGEILILRQADANRDILINAAGVGSNILLKSANFQMTSIYNRLVLQWDERISKWVEIIRNS
jgi:hypothetical protein